MEMRLEWLLGLAWIASTSPILIASLPSTQLSYFHDLVMRFAGRGKIVQPSAKKFTVPQRFFLHFYVFGVMWTTLLLVVTWHYASKTAPMGSLDELTYATDLFGDSHVLSSGVPHLLNAEQRYRVWLSVLLLLLMEIQVSRRLYETAYVFKYSSSARLHILGYLTGFFFYTVAPLSLCHICVLEALNFAAEEAVGFKVRRQELSQIEFSWQTHVKPITRLGWCQWTGAAIFAWGWLHQYRCHTILGSLRKRREQTDQYAIPRGDWFEIVSSPHFLAEMVIYLGLLVASGGTNFIMWLLLLFVVSNLAFAAAETHRWYLKKFANYPRNRWAVIPFVY
ncbi:hypothetical protein K2173_023387 [Erythroxylum novogranatense]|uniref:3-oxo-5-alpha-steroid 4-dehydrogenase C-terminal domain-containing protein n=1 Tax=Erythroxylum novogranatense TaxID=1862640 RepID=A0AAV8TVY6_9ROSI|nr:hypothetical protein K2173_023387 [Erythroxylum novogranatense]